MANLSAFVNFIERIQMGVGILSVAIIAVIIPLQVFCRFVLNAPLIWPEDVGIGLMVWGGFIGSAILYKRNEHVAVDFFKKYFPRKMSLAVSFSIDFIIGFLLVLIIFYGYQLTQLQMMKCRLERACPEAIFTPCPFLLTRSLCSSTISMPFSRRFFPTPLLDSRTVSVLRQRSLTMELTIFLVLFLLLMLAGCPLAFSMILSSLSFIFLSGNIEYITIPQNMTGGLDSFPLLAIPLFLLAGTLMNELGVTDRLFTFASAMVGHITGGLGHVNVLGSMIFAGMSGSAIADAAGLGAIEIEAMNKAGYRTPFSAAVTAASSIIGPIIPPSIPMVVFGSLAGVSVAKLFMGGLIPGIILGLTQMILVYYMAKTGLEKCPLSPRSSVKEMFRAFRKAFLSLLAPVILINGLFVGFFTATEAGGVTVVYTIFLGLLYREITLSKLINCLKQTFLATASVLFLVAGGTVFAWLIALLKIPESIGDFIFGITTNKYLILLLINVFLLIQGCFMSATAGLIIVTPMLLSVVNKIWIDPVHLGVIVVLNLMIGLLTPPVGMVLFVVKEVAKITFEEMVESIIPFYITLIFTLLLITYVPWLVMVLPNLMK